MRETVNILGVPYNVTESDDSLNTNEDGFCNPSAQQIYIRKGICSQRQAQVFLHEVIHAILAQLDRNEEYENEQLIQGLAIGLQMALFPDGLETEGDANGD